MSLHYPFSATQAHPALIIIKLVRHDTFSYAMVAVDMATRCLVRSVYDMFGIIDRGTCI